jgi:uncharacterized protein YceH (UPF0502 family)
MTEGASGGANGPWPVLDVQERRVLGVLVEKAKTTPDAYPLSVNALVTGSNQKSNRDPIMDLDEDDVLEALNRCKGKGLVMKVIGGRVERWRHLLYETWHVDKVELAVLAELLLRGPQTEGELRTRASRMEPIDDLDVLKAKLRPLVERNLVVYLTAEDRRGATLTHGFHDARELEMLKRHAAAAPAAVASAPAPPAPRPEPPPPAAKPDERVTGLVAEVAALRQGLNGALAELHRANERVESLERLLSELRAGLAATQQELQAFRQALGG